MLLILCIILFAIIYILDLKTKAIIKKKMEKFKNNQSYKPKYLNDPTKLKKYKSEMSKKLTITDEAIQTNTFRLENMPKATKLNELDPNFRQNKTVKSKIDSEIFDPELDQMFNSINSINSRKKQSNKSKNVQFNPISTNPESKYKFYHDALFTVKPSEKLVNPKQPNIDQTISQNIMAYTNNNIQSKSEGKELDVNILNEIYKQNQLIQSTHIANKLTNDLNTTDFAQVANKSINGRTIKEIYDNITNDHRLDLQQNLDDLEAFDNGSQFILGEKYGATRFDTYSVGMNVISE
jgi:hypothetical protein